MICFEVFTSYDQYKHSKLTEAERARTPASMIEKLEHDENNPDRENYKPGYILVYMLFYLIVQIVLMLNVLVKEISHYGLDAMVGLQFVYLLVVFIW